MISTNTIVTPRAAEMEWERCLLRHHKKDRNGVGRTTDVGRDRFETSRTCVRADGCVISNLDQGIAIKAVGFLPVTSDLGSIDPRHVSFKAALFPRPTRYSGAWFDYLDLVPPERVILAWHVFRYLFAKRFCFPHHLDLTGPAGEDKSPSASLHPPSVDTIDTGQCTSGATQHDVDDAMSDLCRQFEGRQCATPAHSTPDSGCFYRRAWARNQFAPCLR
ncbi:hypothetical protein HD554DRAFT_307447 [Boletus coccyginus]|nr:hypothetical protein HD554DRAFT_307447 [Boletus coccyginus]